MTIDCNAVIMDISNYTPLYGMTLTDYEKEGTIEGEEGC